MEKNETIRRHIQRIADFLRKNGDRMGSEESVRHEFELLLEENDEVQDVENSLSETRQVVPH